ncbi:hypothetical protein [Halomonas sp. M4R1S46]|uniref:hypothetical protein n=1 Tax=Halomonas sp. M4R1S46 TaxID=2982692 RepID=UPI0021E3FCB7|nr:hypothetical protein [Halomonas sp. M4R1S46]UYG06776.1 hypothetical protein OCT48_14255 [Halomonas sp. M4R1S46]
MTAETRQHAKRTVWAAELAGKRAEELSLTERIRAQTLAANDLAMALDSAALVVAGSPAEERAVYDFAESWGRYRLSPDDSQEMVDAWGDAMEAAKVLFRSPDFAIIPRPEAKTPGTTLKG